MHLGGFFGLFFWNAPLSRQELEVKHSWCLTGFFWYELERLKIHIYLAISQAVKEENEESLLKKKKKNHKTLLVDK